MKKSFQTIIAVITLLIGSTGTLFAQHERPVDIGLKAGVNYSWLSLKDTKNETGLLGYHLGVVARVNITDYFGLQGEALYSTKGSKVTYDNALINGEAKLRLNYIDVPVLLVIKLNENVNLQFGPYASFILDASAVNESNVGLFNFEHEVNKDNFKGTDYGLAGGIGIQVQHLIGGVRYLHGLQKIQKEKAYNGTNYTFTDAKNSTVQLYIGFLF